MGNPVVHFEIGGKDARKLEAFYGSLFDWKITFEEKFNYRSVEKGGEGGIGGGIFQSDDNDPKVRFFVAVDDPQGYLDRAEQLGGKTLMPPTPLPGVGTLAMLSDLEGNAVGLWKAEQP
ncbi:MAG: VOC family protein [Chloroflexi bacterium]|nr:VOC family protein [Chloroflexota bacterium]